MTLAQRLLAILALAVGLQADPAVACMVRPPQLSLSEFQTRSTIIVEGTLTYRYDGDYRMFGSITPRHVIKGVTRSAFSVVHSGGFNPACQSWGWNPPFPRMVKQIYGRFYLFRDESGQLNIAKFVPIKGQ